MTDAILETTALTKQFGALTANDAISLSVERGEIRGIIGPNGSGKTTFFNPVSGFYDPLCRNVVFYCAESTGWAPPRLS